MDFERRAEIRKFITKNLQDEIKNISKEELVEYIKDSQVIALNYAHQLSTQI